MSRRVWTIGHSTRSLEGFLALLHSHDIQRLADVRSFPGSRKYPHFSQDALASALREDGIEYEWMQELGGRRRPRPDSRNLAWRNESFRGYADYMETPAFQDAFLALLNQIEQSRIALMCAEAVWWRCHRSMISDQLCVRGVEVVHILDEKQSRIHPMTSPARVVGGRLTYVQPASDGAAGPT